MKDKIWAFVKENREVSYFFGSVIGFAILFFTLGLFLLFTAKSNFLQAEMLKNRLTGIRKFQQQHSDAMAYCRELNRKLNKLEEQLPRNFDVNELLLRINALAMMENVKIEDLSSSPEVSDSHKTTYKLNGMQINCVGQCQQLLNFMKAVEQEDNLMLFSDVVMEAKENDRVQLFANIICYTR